MNAFNKLVIRTYSLRIIWLIAYIAPFFLLPFWWAIFVIFWSSVLGMVGQMALYSIVRGVLSKGKASYRDYASGACGAISDIVLLTLIIVKFDAPGRILPVVVALYMVNQVNRIYKTIRPNEEEANELMGYAFIFGLYIIFR